MPVVLENLLLEKGPLSYTFNILCMSIATQDGTPHAKFEISVCLRVLINENMGQGAER